MARPTFTIITVTRNQAPLLKGALDSVVAQGVEGVQHIVVDGGSKDETASLASQYPHVTLVTEPFVSESQLLTSRFRARLVRLFRFSRLETGTPVTSFRVSQVRLSVTR